MTAACDNCRRLHLGPRCKPEDQRSVPVIAHLPQHLHRLFTERVPWGERSAWLTRLVEKELS